MFTYIDGLAQRYCCRRVVVTLRGKRVVENRDKGHENANPNNYEHETFGSGIYACIGSPATGVDITPCQSTHEI
jgi:hypothetical protein